MALNLGTGSEDEPEVMVDINTTPLVDVLLVLVLVPIVARVRGGVDEVELCTSGYSSEFSSRHLHTVCESHSPSSRNTATRAS